MGWQTNNAAPPSNLNIGALWRGLLVALGLTVVLILVLAMVLQYTSFKESSLPGAGVLVVVLSNLVGGFFAGQKAGSRGLWHGLGVGLTFALTAILVTLGFFADSFTWGGSFVKSLWSAGGGILGGILGVGFSR